MMLYKLLSASDRASFSPTVMSLIDLGTLGERIESLDVPVFTVGMEPGRVTPGAVYNLYRLAREIKSDVIQGWMYHGNLSALFFSLFMPDRAPVLWNIRQTIYNIKNEKLMTAAIIRIGSRLSRFPVSILYNSYISAAQHERLGYDYRKSIVICNGFDSNLFKPSIEARLKVRGLLGLESEAFLIGLIGRYHPMKDHGNFIKAAGRLSSIRPEIRFVMAGRDVDQNNYNLTGLIENVGLTGRVHLLGECSDMHDITAALDIATSSSAWGEGFPNVIGEAMSCGVPCVVTDVGDSARVVGQAGVVVPPKDENALMQAWLSLLEAGSERLTVIGRTARERVLKEFSLNNIVKKYEDQYRGVINNQINT